MGWLGKVDWTFGKGSVAAFLVLAMSALLRWFDPAAVENLRETVFDHYQQLRPRDASQSPVTVVEIERYSFEEHGNWPWPWHKHAWLIKQLADASPLVVGYDVGFDGNDGHEPRCAIRSWVFLADEQRAVLEGWMAQWPSSDEMLAQAMAGPTPVVSSGFGHEPEMELYGGTGVDYRGWRDCEGERTAAQTEAPRGTGSGARSALAATIRQSSIIVPPIEKVRDAASGWGAANIRGDSYRDIIRKVDLLHWDKEAAAVVPSFALEVFRVGSGATRLGFAGNRQGLREIALAGTDRVIPVTSHGEIRPYFALPARGTGQRSENSELRVKMASGVLGAPAPLVELADRWVIVGVTDTAIATEWLTPLGVRLTGTLIQAQILENLIEESWLVRPRWADTTELVTGIVAGALIIAIVGLATNHAVLIGALSVVFVVSALFAGSFLTFATSRLLLDATAPAAMATMAFAVVSSAVFTITTREQRRIHGELGAARHIQEVMLSVPDDFTELTTGLDIDVLFERAKDIGGDFYDVVPLDAHRSLLLVADVSGKDLDAAMLMARSKSVLEVTALVDPHLEPGEILTLAQARITKGHDFGKFIAIVACVVDTERGELTWALAGHPPPFLVTRRGTRPLTELRPGLPMGLDPEVSYRTCRVKIEPESTIVLATDGALELFDSQAGHMLDDFAAELTEVAKGGDDAGSLLARLRVRMNERVSAGPRDDRTVMVFSLPETRA